MSAPFTFPPPPPPPPKASSPDYGSTASGFSDNSRGGRGGRGGRGRGRGHNQRGGPNRGGYGNAFPRHTEAGYPPGGANHHTQAPVIGVPQTQQYPGGYPLPQYPQQQAAYQHSFPPAPPQYTQPTADAAQLYNQLHSLFNTPAAYPVQSQQPHNTANTPQTWPVPTYQAQSSSNVMNPPIRMGFDDSHAPTAGHPIPDHHTSNAFHHNKRKREGSFGDSHSTHHGFNSNRGRGRQQHGQPYRSKPNVAPAVPNFGFALPTLPAKPPPSARSADEFSKKNKKRKFNQLGLTPRGEVHEDSDNEVDEEAGFAATDGFLSFQYKGQTSTLGSAAEIDAWIEERKKRFPTKARVEQKKQEDMKRMQEREEVRRNALINARIDRKREKEKEKEKKKSEKQKDEGQSRTALDKDLLKAEKLRRKLAKLEAKTAKAAAAAAGTSQAASMPDAPAPEGNSQVDPNGEPITKAEPEDEDYSESALVPPVEPVPGLKVEDENEHTEHLPAGSLDNNSGIDPTLKLEETLIAQLQPGTEPQQSAKVDLGLAYDTEDSEDVSDDSDSMSVSSSDISSDSDDSSSDSSEDGSDLAPDEESSRRTAPTRVPAPDRNQRTCKFFQKTGRCRYGDNCRYRHDAPDERRQNKRNERAEDRRHQATGRVRLYDRLLEQEQNQQDLLVLQAIKYLGSSGFLD